MNSGKERMIGVGIVAVGLIILLGKLGTFSFLGRNLWPLLILIPGIVLHAMYMMRKVSPFMLLPAGILSVYGFLFFLCNTWGWHLMVYLWPMFLLGVAIGLWEYAINDISLSRNVYTGSVLLGLISVLLLIITLLSTGIMYIIAVLLIGAGIWLVINNRSKRNW
ncbi:hypothetical protein ACT3XG_16400 [Paenibacillus polymyxa]|uniref:hypothetical protein n=1 Tax=Paenibacillus TaxID=44249 RepID=UPI0002F77CD9|nr:MULTISPECIES: hypothetical protein [Paenibacillus]AHM67011.1 hypothetical protein PPSQR21_033730 [Paenibacillus polymyxa SQR-21]AIY07812.1 hypothetical protein LK13_04060 [Paenibacillus polymyxa]AUS27594.1 hypothetical protein C1A50_3430 [Paenibacillus polymyxa]KAF6617211.1 hypothetical protein HFE00_13100 [Paenibacillus sp. EKM101P]KAF6622013.1 hypothetical protein HFE03_12915 [Paenibacillus sp. EKM102P]